MPDEFLSPAELFKATGKTQPAAQIRHLRRMGIKAERSDNPDNPVVVARSWLAVSSRPVAESQKPMLKSDRGRHGQAAPARH